MADKKLPDENEMSKRMPGADPKDATTREGAHSGQTPKDDHSKGGETGKDTSKP